MNSKIKIAAGLLLFFSPALAGMLPTPTTHERVTVTPLVADQQGAAPNTDPNLVNSWGLSRDDEGLLWVTDNGTDLATSYDSNTGVPTGTAINITPPRRMASPVLVRQRPDISSGTLDSSHRLHAVLDSPALTRHGPLSRDASKPDT